MPANRPDHVIIDGVAHEIIYAHDSNSITLKAEDSVFVLGEVEGQYVLERPQRRDLVANELLSLADRGLELTSQDLLPYGFRRQ